MLQELRVSNFAIIDNIQLEFRTGLNILSGETGAGKSILLKSLGLLMGEKSEASDIRTGHEMATIEGLFDISKRPDIKEKLETMGIESREGTMIVRRMISTNQRARVYINGALSNLTALRELVSPLVEVTGQAVPLIELTGQHDNRHLLSKAFHLEMLDLYAGTTALRHQFQTQFSRLKEIHQQIVQTQADERNRVMRLDFLQYSQEEISALQLCPGDEVLIEQEARRIKSATRLLEFAGSAQNLLDGEDESILSILQTLVAKASDLTEYDQKLSDLISPLEQTIPVLSDVVHELRQYAEGLEFSPEALEEAENKLSKLRQLQKKYGLTAEVILASLKDIEAEIQELSQIDIKLDELKKEAFKIEKTLAPLAEDLHQKRTAAADLFAKEVNSELTDLNMKGVTFLVSVKEADQLTLTGKSEIEFQTQTSKKDAPRALAKAASGGELSRILLSLKQVVGGSDSMLPRTYLFDEVDTGVSGETADKVGRKLHAISFDQQVVCVTHLPQVAAHGDAHYYIEKQKQGAAMSVHELTHSERINEVARLISGEKLSSTSLAHAKQLLNDVAEKKSKLGGKAHSKGGNKAINNTNNNTNNKTHPESGLVIP